MKEGDEVCIIKLGSDKTQNRAKLLRKLVFVAIEYGGGQYEAQPVDAWELETSEGVCVIEERYLTKLI